MNGPTTQYESFQEAFKKLNELKKEASAAGIKMVDAPVGEHLNPGDVYDAYEALKMDPLPEDVLDGNRCGPLVAVVLFRFKPEDPTTWEKYVDETFHPRYVSGFRDGIRLILPEKLQDFLEDTFYLRGIYDGVMSHSAIF